MHELREDQDRREVMRKRKAALDRLIDIEPLLTENAQRYIRGRARWRGFWVAFAKGVTVFSALVVGLVAIQDKIVAIWHWLWSSHGGSQ